MSLTLEELIRQCIPLGREKNGWYAVLCKVCNDHGKKGKRAAFRFDEGRVSYNCFNCGHTAGYSPNQKELKNEMKQVLDGFSVPEDEYNAILLDNMKRLYEHGYQKTATKQDLSIEPKEVPLPDHFYPIADDPDDKWSIIAADYLEQRGFDPSDHPYMVSTGVSKTDRMAKKWKGRVIIPLYKGNKLIFYMGRELVSLGKKYESCSSPRENVFGQFDTLLEQTDDPLYVVEGWFDAKAIGGVASLGNRLTSNQIKWLNRTSREKIIIPDRYGDGYLMAEQALSQGWSIATPEIGSCKDMAEAVAHFGRLYVKSTIKQNTSTGFEATMRLQMYCTDYNNDKNRSKG
jgi:hypothetical protein